MDIDDQVTYLMQGTEYGDLRLKEEMATELRDRLVLASRDHRPLQVYCGYDPRRADLHLGHTVTMRKLRQFQELGHEVTFLIGDYTSLIGDPSDTDKLRPRLTPQQIAENGRTYAEQAFRILDRDKTRIRYNSEWLSRIGLADFIHLASNFTVQQFLQRENFKLRWRKEDAVYLHETFYAVMQGYDAYSMKADVQVGGTDQLFNIVTAARKVMVALGEMPNIAIILGILPGTDGVVKMSKSLGNVIPLNAAPGDMFGRVMSLPDRAMQAYMTLVTRWPPGEIEQFLDGLKSGAFHPKDVKMMLAFEIVSALYDNAAAEQARDAFVQVFQRRQLPDTLPVIALVGGLTVTDILIRAGLVASKSAGKRLIDQKGVRLDGQLVIDGQEVVSQPGVLTVGKRHAIRLVKG